MQKIISLIRTFPGFRSQGNPVRKVIAGFVYSSVLLYSLVGVASRVPSPQVKSGTTQAVATPTTTPTLTPSPTPTPSSTPFDPLYADITVTNVIDGDTFTIEGGKVVRMIGMDTPETVHPSKPIQCYGNEASAKTTELIEGQKVRLEKDVSETDKYKRLLRYVWKGDVLINELLVQEGYAQSSSYPPDIKYQDRFVTAQQEARDNQKGLWGSVCTSTPTPTPKLIPMVTAKPTAQPIAPSVQNTGGSWVCNCSKTCANMSCDEAQYQLNICGCSRRDADGDGVACDAQCQ